MVASLAEALTRAVAVGDEVAARVVFEAIGRLLGLPLASGVGVEAAAMVDLAREPAQLPRR
ncbi:hypothetical protein [Sorangium sp. So ce124]|uniref:hypothetical protein n=1 Tax=Sorangium sp. So ce124 TaxID=3133280 RepID=UPI003F643A41